MLTTTAIDDIRFAVTKFREGYEQAAVDAFLTEARAALAVWEQRTAGTAPALTGDAVVDWRFPPTKFGNGYDQDQVDDFLDAIVGALRAHEAGAAAIPAAAPSAARSDEPLPLAKSAAGPVLRSSAILDKRFTVTRFREGYSQEGVDGFLEAARTALAEYERSGVPAEPALSGNDVVNVRFRPTKFRAGYSQDEVDTYLDEIVVAIRHHEQASGRV
jgi:DivIVA domain-containing protein